MAVATVTGSVKDLGLTSMGDRVPELVFSIDEPLVTMGNGTLIPAEDKVVVPASDGSFSVALQESLGTNPYIPYKLTINWQSRGIPRTESPSWRIVVPPGGGAIADLLAVVTPSKIITKGEPGDANPVTIAAAQTAATDTVTNMDVARRKDPAMPGVVGNDLVYVEIATDAAGSVTRGTLTNGTQHLPSLLADRADIGGERAVNVPGTDYMRAAVDLTGAIAEPFAVGPDGCTPMWVLERWAARMAPLIAPAIGLVPYGKIACFGDSMTFGYLGGGPTYPAALATALGVEVQNYGVTGQTSHEIALRQGGLKLALTVTGNTIPASGPVAITAYTPTGVWRSGFAWSFLGTLAGVPGTLTKAADNTWTFTRTEAGAATPCLPGTVFVSAQQTPAESWIQIMWAGRNNPTSAPVVKADIDSMVAALKPVAKKFLVLSVFNGQDEPSGSAGYNNVIAINNALAAAYPDNYVDHRRWFIDSGLAAAGITPTAADTTAISEDRVPPSLMVDNLHLTGLGYTTVGNYLATVVTAKGFLS